MASNKKTQAKTYSNPYKRYCSVYGCLNKNSKTSQVKTFAIAGGNVLELRRAKNIHSSRADVRYNLACRQAALESCTNNAFNNLDKKYHLVSQSYKVAKNLFDEGKDNYNKLKNKSLFAIDTFLDLVHIMNEEMAKELRTSIIKFYKIKYFHDFTNYAISMEEIIDIAEHCLVEPVEKLEQIRNQFHSVIRNFEDVRNFNVVDKCANELPDEVAAAHCVLHQAVLFNETMQDSLITIVEIKTRQHAQDMNSSMYGVQKCLNDFVPKFFDQLLVDAYTSNCGYLKVVNASISDLLQDKWKHNRTIFPTKWGPLVKILKEKVKDPIREPLFLTLFSANLTSKDVLNALY